MSVVPARSRSRVAAVLAAVAAFVSLAPAALAAPPNIPTKATASVVTGGDCAPTSGSWYSEYDGITISPSSGVDIDHVVPLAEAWRSGAASWTTGTRQAFANDGTRPQLIAVGASASRSKGDQDPSTWQPTRTSYRCTYSKMWIASKHYWGLQLQSTEKSALQIMLNTCP